MKILILVLCLLIVGCQDTSQQTTAKPSKECPITIHFSPKGGVTDSIVAGIKDTNNDIRIQAFSFTSLPIAQALIDVKKSGKTVEAILDRENLGNKSSVLKSLYTNGIVIYIDDRHAIAHNKLIIIDNKKVFTGSFNFSKGAEEHNAENSILIEDAKIAELYIENWTLHKEHSYLYSPKE